MASDKIELSDSGVTVPSDSENYSANNEMNSSVHSTSSSPLVLYKPPSVWGVVRGAAINLLLPFVNGLMLGFGELFAHEAAFRLGWSNTKVLLLIRSSYPDVYISRFLMANTSCRYFQHTAGQDPWAPGSNFETPLQDELPG